MSAYRKRVDTAVGVHTWCRDCLKAYDLAYRAKNRDAIRAKRSAYYRSHKQECINRASVFYYNNLKSCLATRTIYREKNSEKVKACNKNSYLERRADQNRWAIELARERRLNQQTRDELGDRYVKSIIRLTAKIPATVPIPDQLIATKRAHLKITRLIKERKWQSEK